MSKTLDKMLLYTIWNALNGNIKCYYTLFEMLSILEMCGSRATK